MEMRDVVEARLKRSLKRRSKVIEVISKVIIRDVRGRRGDICSSVQGTNPAASKELRDVNKERKENRNC